jgi:hypothetical protein
MWDYGVIVEPLANSVAHFVKCEKCKLLDSVDGNLDGKALKGQMAELVFFKFIMIFVLFCLLKCQL